MSEKLSVEYDPLTGNLVMNFPLEMSGDIAMGLLAHTLYAVYVRTLKETAQFPVSAFGKICIQVEDGKLSIAFGFGDSAVTMTADPVKAKGVLMAAWLALSEKTATGEYDPAAALVEGLKL